MEKLSMAAGDLSFAKKCRSWSAKGSRNFVGQLWMTLPKGVGPSKAEKLYLAGFRSV